MWKIIILLVAAYVLYKLCANDFFKKRKEAQEASKEEENRKIAAGEMVKDPECGTFVSVDDSISVKDGAKTYYFCSYECRDKFLQRLEEGGRDIPRHDSED